MLFSSITFLYVFLPCVLLCYYLVPKKLRNYALLLASLFFYAWGEPKLVLVMLAEIALAYISGLLLEKYSDRAPSKIFLGASLFFFLGALGYYKYVDFFITSIGRITGISIKTLGVVLPIGISFYTFQIISYVVDVYRKDVPAQKNPFYLATYVAMFPQLIAGPIVRYEDVERQLVGRVCSFDKFAVGVRRFVFGLGKKVLIANSLGQLCDLFKSSGDLSVAYYWLYAAAYTLHIYFDFSGYSDMAIGLGKMLGFDLKENFDYPYMSKSITEFWRRWHMSLGSWFRDYVYIPLGGNRVSKWKWYRNIVIVWFLTGFWHGAAWNFAVWGLFFAFFLVLEKEFLYQKLAKANIWNHIYVMAVIIIGFVIFDADSMGQAGERISCMFGMGGLPFFSREAGYYAISFCIIMLAAIAGATSLPAKLLEKVRTTSLGSRALDFLEPIVLLGILVIVTAYLVDGSFNPFLYFRF